MKARRAGGRQTRLRYSLRRYDEAVYVKSVIPYFREKPLGRLFGARTKTDTGRQVEHTKAIERTMVKELGIMTP